MVTYIFGNLGAECQTLIWWLQGAEGREAVSQAWDAMALVREGFDKCRYGGVCRAVESGEGVTSRHYWRCSCEAHARSNEIEGLVLNGLHSDQ
jgi:hypothetical protein